MATKINSRQKGARGEREFAALCRKYGYECRRGQQYSGIEGDDVVGLPGVHIEVKRVEKLNLDKAMAQSVRDAGEKIPIVVHRKNGDEWKITMLESQWFELYKAWEERHRHETK
ncbi:MAG: hypothetical protein RSB90_11200 [Eubacterium sp.]